MADQAPSRDTAPSLERRGLMFILSSPSGAGKTTISHMLLERDAHIRLSVSVTTRPIRPGELEGRDYYFTDREDFDRRVTERQFLEWAQVFDHGYGTPKAEIRTGLDAGHDFLFDIDWQGTQQLYQKMAGDVVRVFLLPPSLAELRRRLNNRGTDSKEIIAARMARAQSEISHWDGYDYVVVNDDVETCYDRVAQILAAERLRRARQTGLIDFVRDLMKPES